MSEMNFTQFNLKEELVAALTAQNFKTPTPVQENALPLIIEGKDILAQAETGSGKTGAFIIPLLHKVLTQRETEKEEEKTKVPENPRYLVLSPTRELAQQTNKVASDFGKELNISSVCVIGGENIDKQIKSIRDGVDILVATPGRVVDLVKQGIFSFSDCQGMVLDEADRLFDMGFKDEVQFILSKMPKSRQLMMFSATNNIDVINTAYKFHSQPVEVKLNTDSLVVDHLDHYLAQVADDEKMPLLVGLLRERKDHYAIIFCNTQIQTHIVSEWLNQLDFKSKAISGALAQNKRTKLMEDFRSKSINILVCTDVAARGLDIKDVNFVVNFELPSEPANYVHRIGRTGRAGQEGMAVSLCSFDDCQYLEPIKEVLEGTIPPFEFDETLLDTQVGRKPYIDRKTLKPVKRNDNMKKDVNGNRMERPTKNNARNNEHKPKTRSQNTPKKIHAHNDRAKPNTREFIFSTTDASLAFKKACDYFPFVQKSLITHEILEKGKRKFIFFGAKSETKYRYFVKNDIVGVVKPYIEDLLMEGGINLDVSFNELKSNLKITFTGRDEKLLDANDGQLAEDLEYIINKFVGRTMSLKKFYKVKVFSKAKKAGIEKKLENLAKKIKGQVIKDGAAVVMKPLNPADRRIVHQYFNDAGGFKTSSLGDGRMKKIKVEQATK